MDVERNKQLELLSAIIKKLCDYYVNAVNYSLLDYNRGYVCVDIMLRMWNLKILFTN